jgi:hypothetical protein
MSSRTAGEPRRSPLRSRTGRALAGAVAASVAVAGVSFVSESGASAATAPAAQSAGNFLDATVGTQTLDPIAKLAFARAQAPGSTSTQNPLDVTALNAINLPLTGALQLPQLLGINLGAANQVALAKLDGESYGASGAVLNSGGVSVGGNNSAPPAGATINLTASGLAGNSPIPIPGGTGSADALGGVTATINGVSSIARTPQFGPALASGWPSVCTQSSPTCYDIATLQLKLGSPLLGGLIGGLLQTLSSTLGGLVTQLTNAVGGLPGGATALQSCALTSPTAITQPISLEGGAVVINPTDGSITIDVEKLLKQLNLDIDALPANTDLLAKVLNYLASPSGLAAGIEGVINGLTGTLTTQFNNCKAAITAIPAIGPILTTLIDALVQGQTTLENTINQIVSGLANAGGPNPLAPIGTLLAQLIDIGVNVQPQVSTGDFTTKLNALPKQNMTPPPVPYEHTVRALEVQLLGGAINLALANSAAGPSNPAGPPSSSTPPVSTVAPTQIPTGVPAGQATHGGPVAPIVLLIVGLALAAAGSLAWRVRGRHAG